MRRPRFDYRSLQRHVLLDMHLPDWNTRLLSDHSPQRFVALCKAAGAQAVMHYCNSHIGLTLWPSAVGTMHRNLKGRDLVRETVALLHDAGLASCAYYSSYFNNDAWESHPDWRVVSAAAFSINSPRTRYGVCCPNNRDYARFQLTQVEELAAGYEFDAFWFDMVFWTDVCVCASCLTRYREETGTDIPQVVDWTDPAWCRYSDARERWLSDAYGEIKAAVKRHVDIPVFCNISPTERPWRPGLSERLLAQQDMMGGDFAVFGADPYPTAHLLSAHPSGGLQYMNALTAYVGSDSWIMEKDGQLRGHAVIALLFGAQFLAIDAVDPEGGVNPGYYLGDLKDLFSAIAPYEQFRGGRPMIEVGVYASDRSRVSLKDNGRALADLVVGDPPHLSARRGALRALRDIPSGVLTRSDLHRLSEVRVIVLANTVRMDAEEIAAFRDFVSAGGKLYASGDSGLLDPETGAQTDALAAVLGFTRAGTETCSVAFARPDIDALQRAIAPRRVATHGNPRQSGAPTLMNIPLVSPGIDTTTLASLELPYGNGLGDKSDRLFCSIHASPPFRKSASPAILRRRYGAGEVVYSALDLERDTPAATDETPDRGAITLFRALIELLLADGPPLFRVNSDRGVLAVAFADKSVGGVRIHVANHQPHGPFRSASDVSIDFAAPVGQCVTAVTSLPDGATLPFVSDGERVVRIEIGDVDLIKIIAVRLTPLA